MTGYIAPWQCLNFLPDPQGQGSLRPTFWPARVKGGAAAGLSGAAASAVS
jgi:hypothetical protein